MTVAISANARMARPVTFVLGHVHVVQAGRVSIASMNAHKVTMVTDAERGVPVPMEHPVNMLPENAHALLAGWEITAMSNVKKAS